ncbi:hypothetical protein BJ165DRAFT_242086 [Panaeolus papilionaceus]|nr:hypothetical protein BJ165DRAFT_242086 [Panaeolus papilionaceus]
MLHVQASFLFVVALVSPIISTIHSDSIVIVVVCLVFLCCLFILSETSWYFLPQFYLAASLHHPVPHRRIIPLISINIPTWISVPCYSCYQCGVFRSSESVSSPLLCFSIQFTRAILLRSLACIGAPSRDSAATMCFNRVLDFLTSSCNSIFIHSSAHTDRP